MRKKAKEIPVELLKMDSPSSQNFYSKRLLENEIAGVEVEQIILIGEKLNKEELSEDRCYFYLFINGSGQIVADKENLSVDTESILVPNSVQNLAMSAKKGEELHFLKISSELTDQDRLDIQEFPKENTEKLYFAKFTDCAAYTEPIKSPDTISRTILPNKFIPRIALGTVETTGPDKVAPHEHAMLEQLFFGLTDNNVDVKADDIVASFPAYSLLHIPLGSSHSVSVKEGAKMYYIWMDFFMDKAGEEWLKTHNHIDD